MFVSSTNNDSKNKEKKKLDEQQQRQRQTKLLCVFVYAITLTGKQSLRSTFQYFIQIHTAKAMLPCYSV